MDDQVYQVVRKRGIKLERLGRWEVALALLPQSRLFWTEY